MQRKERAAEAIMVAEKAIASLVADAGQDRQWDEAALYIDLGRRLNALVESLSDRPPAAAAMTAAASVATVKPAKKAAYPQFYREGDSLVKVAWSKSQRGEYEHKSPYKVVPALVDALLKAGAKGQRFTMDKLLPLRDSDAPHSPWPDYQPYLCLAWLRHEGLVKQHGRSGYSIPKTMNLAQAAMERWNQMTAR
jgi:hypothetical protein